MKLSKTLHWEHDYKLHKYTQNVIDNIIKYFNDNNLYCYIELEHKSVTTREHFWLSREIATGIQILFHHPHKKLISYYDYDKYAQNMVYKIINQIEDKKLICYCLCKMANESSYYNTECIYSNFKIKLCMENN